MLNIITTQTLHQKRVQERIAMLEAQPVPTDRARAVLRELRLAELYQGKIPQLQYAEDFNFKKHIDFSARDRGTGIIGEFISTGDFDANFITRQRYEVDAGRDLEPLLFQSIYDVQENAAFPRTMNIYVLGPVGVVFAGIPEGGEVKFATIGSRNQTLTIEHYGVGIKYSEELFLYNETWNLAALERQFGQAYNALLNYIHFNPILTYTYTGNNTTDGTALTSFRATADRAEKIARTLDSAVATASTDTTNPRRGNYWLLCGSADVSDIERALMPVPQQGFSVQSNTRNRISGVIVYDGWTGSRGEETTTYAGVTAGKAYLVDTTHRMNDFQSRFKHGLRQRVGQENVTRFIKAEMVWDVRVGVFADPVRAVHEIDLPGATDGAS